MRLSGGDGLAPAGQLMDVSRLLRLCQARGWGALPAEDLLLCLKRQELGRYQPGGGVGGGGGLASGGRRGREERLRAVCGSTESHPLFWGRRHGPAVGPRSPLPLSPAAPASLWSLPF